MMLILFVVLLGCNRSKRLCLMKCSKDRLLSCLGFILGDCFVVTWEIITNQNQKAVKTR